VFATKIREIPKTHRLRAGVSNNEAGGSRVKHSWPADPTPNCDSTKKVRK